MSEFTLLDWIVVAILAYSIATSIVRGFVREVLGLATLAAALLVAALFYRRLGTLLAGILQTENLALFVGFLLLFAATFIAGFMLIRVIRKFIEFAHIQWFDRLLGGAFGLLRGWLIAAVIFLVLTSFGVQIQAVRDSRLSPYFLPAVRALAVLAPFDLKARFLIGYEGVERWWSERLLADQTGETGVDFEPADASPD